MREVDERVVLPDGRQLGWATYGDRGGAPVVAIHGSPDARVMWQLYAPAAERHGLCLLAPDRPGFGISDPKPRRTVLDWPDDVAYLSDHLGLDRFPVLAVSGGGAYAVACAWKLPQRVSGLGLFSVIGPLDAPGARKGMNAAVRAAYALARHAPWLLTPLVRKMSGAVLRDREKAALRMERTRPPMDIEVLRRPEVRRVAFENMPNQFRDPDSIALEFRLAARPWGIPLGEINVPTHIWQGGRDSVHTPAMARYLATQIPGAELTLEPDFATFTFLDHLDPIMSKLAGWAYQA